MNRVAPLSPFSPCPSLVKRRAVRLFFVGILLLVVSSNLSANMCSGITAIPLSPLVADIKSQRSLIFTRGDKHFLVSIAKGRAKRKEDINPFLVRVIREDGSMGPVKSYPIKHNGLNYFIRDFERFETSQGEFILATIENSWLSAQSRYAIATFRLNSSGEVQHIDTESVKTLSQFANKTNFDIGFQKYWFKGAASAQKGGYKTPYVLNIQNKYYFMGAAPVRRQSKSTSRIEAVATFTEISADGNILATHHYRDDKGEAILGKNLVLQTAGFISTKEGRSFLISTDRDKGLLYTREIIINKEGYPTVQKKYILKGSAKMVSVNLITKAKAPLLIVGDREKVSVYRFSNKHSSLWQKVGVVSHGNQLATRKQQFAEVAASVLDEYTLLLAIEDLTTMTKPVMFHKVNLVSKGINPVVSQPQLLNLPSSSKIILKPINKIANSLIFNIIKFPSDPVLAALREENVQYGTSCIGYSYDQQQSLMAGLN